jgi:CheY-like chemotaxis protein
VGVLCRRAFLGEGCTLLSAGPDSGCREKKESTMTAGNTDNAGGQSTLLGVSAIHIAPHILIAEDQPAIQELLCWMFQLAGYHTTVCAGREVGALAWREQCLLSGDEPIVLLLDLSVPTMDAADILHRLRARWQEVYGVLPEIIVLTTSQQVQAALAPQERVVLKPFHIRTLLNLVQEVLSCIRQ